MTVNRTELTGSGPQPPAATGQPCPIEGVVYRTEMTGRGSIGHTTGHTTGQICPRSRGSRGSTTTHRGRATGQICPVFREGGRAELPVKRGGVNKNDPPRPSRPIPAPRSRRPGFVTLSVTEVCKSSTHKGDLQGGHLTVRAIQVRLLEGEG